MKWKGWRKHECRHGWGQTRHLQPLNLKIIRFKNMEIYKKLIQKKNKLIFQLFCPEYSRAIRENGLNGSNGSF
jgi:hypothetical protein